MLPEPAILLNEKSALRDELKHLKLCQLNYFTISVTATGALLGLGSKIGTGDTTALLYFSPLLIILPCWWIFFDKATTIARIVGYLTTIDWILSCPGEKARYRYIGWEAALHYYRKNSEEKPVRFGEWIRRWGRGLWFGLWVLAFRTSHRYWSINFYTYAALSLICWGLGSGFLLGGPSYAALFTRASSGLLLVIAISFVYNLYLAGDLIKGTRSYRAHAKAWAKFLRAEIVEELLVHLLEEESLPQQDKKPRFARFRRS